MQLILRKRMDELVELAGVGRGDDASPLGADLFPPFEQEGFRQRTLIRRAGEERRNAVGPEAEQ